MDYTVHGILHSRILEWVAFPFSRGFFPIQGSNSGFPHCRWILLPAELQGKPMLSWEDTYSFGNQQLHQWVAEPTQLSQEHMASSP